MKRIQSLLFALGVVALASSGMAQVPGIINYQGRVAVGGTNFNGTGQFKLSLVNAAGSTTYWSNGNAAVSLTVTKGLFSVLLGDTTIANMSGPVPASVFSNSDVRLHVTFNDGVTGVQTLAPDQRLAAVGYALVANSVNPASDVTGLRLNIGFGNTLSGTLPTIAGGSNNTASADYTTIGGGLQNSATAIYATVGGGGNNIASGQIATIGGGGLNHALASYATVGGGQTNTASSAYATVGGGYSNGATGQYATVSGGYQNTASGYIATVGAGYVNAALGDYSIVGGGANNTASGLEGTIGGGYQNIAGVLATVGGGSANTSTGLNATVSGGATNIASGDYSMVGGGLLNTASGFAATVGGGKSNIASGVAATVAGGAFSTATGQYSFAGGLRAKAIHNGAFVWGDSTVADFTSTGNNQFLIRTSGGVGINTATPGQPLQVGDNVTAPSVGMIRLASHSGTGAAARMWDVGVPMGNEDTGTTNYSFVVKDVASGAQPEFMIQWGTGNVGIGTNSPATKLHVAGTITAAGNITANGGITCTGSMTPNGGVTTPGISCNALTVAGIMSAGSGTALFLTSISVNSNITAYGTISCVSLTQTSDRNLKANFTTVDGRDVLAKVAALPITGWNYKQYAGERHIGPIAQDFYAAFQVGPDDRHITTIDEGGVALAAIQGLNEIVKEKDARITELERRLTGLEATMQKLSDRTEAKR